MRKPRITPKRAVWAGLVGTPLALIAVLAAVGVGTAPAAKDTTKSGALAKSLAADRILPTIRADTSAAASKAYWTPERMASAKPLTGPEPASAQATVAGDSATGSPGVAGGLAPANLVAPGSAEAESSTSTANFGKTSAGIVPADGGYPGPGTFFKWYPKYRQYPVSTIAKMFFTQRGSNFSCSASATYGGAALNTVFTAGHCVHEGGTGDPAGWSSNILICPSYLNGINPPVGCWAWTSESTTPEWYFNGAFSRDYGVVRVSSCGTVNCTNIVSYTGGLGFAWNWGRDQHWMNFGYPGLPNPPFNGGAINTCAAEHRYDVATDIFGPATNSMGCNSGRGSSGGPWILGFSESTGYINSVNSWLYLAQEGHEIQGPYFDTTSCSDWKSWTGWGGAC
jgi:hypothetical protein